MSVLIKGMKKPEKCEDCRCICSCGDGWRCGLVVANGRRHGCSLKELHDDCPLVELPTADVRENVHGEWIKIHWKAFRCSECKKVSEYYTNFCPNCGADMRKEVKNDRK